MKGLSLQYNSFNTHAHSHMQTECIVTGDKNLIINITVRFLHLKKIEILQKRIDQKTGNDNFIPVFELNLKGEIFQSGWQTIERKLTTGDLPVAQLLEKTEMISFEFDKEIGNNFLYHENGEEAAKKISSILEMKGSVMIKAFTVQGNQNAFRINVSINNSTPVTNAEEASRDEIFRQSFLSTHTILNTMNGEFISIQNPGENWKDIIANCENKDTWPILIDESNTTLLSSPIIVYDYPKINPKSKGDLFDSLEIEEALMLHFTVMSDEEKQKIAQSDEKLRSMLNKVSQVTPDEIISLHGGFSDALQPTNNNNKE